VTEFQQHLFSQLKESPVMFRIFFLITSVLVTAVNSASAAPLTGVYDTFTGIGSQTTPANDPTGPWQLTSSNTTFSFLGRVTNENPTFSQLTDLHVVFSSPTVDPDIDGDGTPNEPDADMDGDGILDDVDPYSGYNTGGGGGAPRFRLLLDNGGTVGSISIHLGTGPSYIDTPASLSALSGMNLIGNNDGGRYELQAFGGSHVSTYNDALALLGNAQVLRIGVLLDSFGGADKILDVQSVNGAFTAPVPEPATLVLAGLALLDSYSAGAAYLVEGLNVGNNYPAARFTTGPSSYVLTSAELPVGTSQSPYEVNTMHVQVRSDAAGLPDSVLDSTSIGVPYEWWPVGVLATANFGGAVVLQPNTTYWLVASAEVNQRLFWSQNVTGDIGVARYYADPGLQFWDNGEFNLSPAFRINGTAVGVPEPSAIALAVLAALCTAALYRRK
jgi:hypothetical protein